MEVVLPALPMTPSLPAEAPAVSPLDAGLLLAALPIARRLGLAAPTATDVLAAANVSRSRAYELKTEIEGALPALARPPGRPRAPEAPPTPRPDLEGAVLDYVYAHPGSVHGERVRRRYSDGFRRFILELAATHRDVSLDDLAAAVRVPVPTLKDWLRGGIEATKSDESLATVSSPDPTGPQVEQLLALWATWQGAFRAFCRHANEDWRLPFGHTLIATILTAHGVRFAKRRSGRSPDEDGLRGAFQTFYPNAQWVGDGALIKVTYGEETFDFNLELIVDPRTGAFVGAAVTDTEDAAAVVAAVEDAVVTTGSTPLSVLLDNKPSNHAESVKESVAPSVVERATPYRPQNKAHGEGAFGLFRQVAPALALIPGVGRELARQFVIAVVTMWARTLNHRPRADRHGKSRVQLHLDHTPTADELAAATAALAERLRKQALARETLAARQDPLVRQALAEAFGRLAFADPDGQLLNATARYPLDAVVDGIAIVEGKRRAGTLPADADARYLLGVVRNLAEEREGWAIALALWDERKRANDRALDAAERARDRIDEEVEDTERRVATYVDRGLGTNRRLDRFFWLTAVADLVLDQDPAEHRSLFLLAARRIHATRAVPHRDRLAAARFLAAKVVPVA
jgi:hypothetical protein